MVNDTVIEKWKQGIYTDYGLYTECDTDKEFYDTLKKEGYADEDIKEIMNEVSGSDDAFNNVISQKEVNEVNEVNVEVTASVTFPDGFEKEIKVELYYDGDELEDMDDDKELYNMIYYDYMDEVLDSLEIDIVNWKRIKGEK